MNGKRLKRERKRAGLSQREFAEKIGVSVSCIQKLEYGLTMPRNLTTKAIQAVLAEMWRKERKG